MNYSLLKKLKKWRDETAKKEGVEAFRVLSNRALEDIAKLKPRTKEELIGIKGIKDKKYRKYGREILAMVKSESKGAEDDSVSLFSTMNYREGDSSENVEEYSNSLFAETEINKKFSSESRDNNFLTSSPGDLARSGVVRNSGLEFSSMQERVYTVSVFLDLMNDIFRWVVREVRVKGEVSNVGERDRVIYFDLKDKEDGSVLHCLIFRYQYEISGVRLEEGKEVIVCGLPEVYKPFGKFSLKVSLIEITGEGALKKAYEELKAKLEKEGLFSPQRKKPIPDFPSVIGLITSSSGAAIGDFMTNLGSYGFKIKFINSTVEGKQAVFDLIRAVRLFKKMKDVDVIVIVRGGGSLESLQAFNNEMLVREVASCEIPVICGVGHEKDISLVSLASDLSVSTPTAAARAVRESWDQAVQRLNHNQKAIVDSFEKCLFVSERRIEKMSYNLINRFREIFYKFDEIQNQLVMNLRKLSLLLAGNKKSLDLLCSQILLSYEKALSSVCGKIKAIENSIRLNNPERQIRLGYSIVFKGGKVIKSIKQVKKGDKVDIKISDGKIKSVVESFTYALDNPGRNKIK